MRQSETTQQRKLVQLLATLRQEGRQQSGLDPQLAPPDKPTAYRIAHMIAPELGEPVAGWKVAANKAKIQQALRTDAPIYGRVFGRQSMSIRILLAALANAFTVG